MAMDFSERLKISIDKTGLNVDAFSKQVGVSRAQIYNYLNMTSEPPLSFFQKFRNLFPDVDMNWLLTGEEKGEGAGKKLEILPQAPEDRRARKLQAMLSRVVENGDQAKIDLVEGLLKQFDPGEKNDSMAHEKDGGAVVNGD